MSITFNLPLRTTARSMRGEERNSRLFMHMYRQASSSSLLWAYWHGPVPVYAHFLFSWIYLQIQKFRPFGIFFGRGRNSFLEGESRYTMLQLQFAWFLRQRSLPGLCRVSWPRFQQVSHTSITVGHGNSPRLLISMSWKNSRGLCIIFNNICWLNSRAGTIQSVSVQYRYRH